MIAAVCDLGWGVSASGCGVPFGDDVNALGLCSHNSYSEYMKTR